MKQDLFGLAQKMVSYGLFLFRIKKKNEIFTRGTNSMPFLIFRTRGWARFQVATKDSVFESVKRRIAYWKCRVLNIKFALNQ